MDASGSITFAWPGVRQFVANVVRQVNVSADGSHIGVIKFGADSNVEFGFSEGQDQDAVINRVLNLAGPEPFANTQLHLGIKDADEKLYNEATSSYRTDPSVRKVRPYYFLQQESRSRGLSVAQLVCYLCSQSRVNNARSSGLIFSDFDSLESLL